MELQVKDLAVSRGGIRILHGLNFQLKAGQALVLRGPNGIGKTTLLRSLAGLQPPLAGSLSVPLDSLAYASHADGLKAVLTVQENLEFWCDLYGTDRSSIDAALIQMDLTTLTQRHAAQLSAGQKRRLGLARLMVTGRPIWLLDEPTVSLDQASVTLFAQMLRQHLTQGGSALIATHIDLGLPEIETLDLSPWDARKSINQPQSGDYTPAGFDEAFL